MKTYDVTSFFDASEDMITIVDADGYFRRMNPSFTKVLGYERKELEHKKFIEFVHPDDRERTSERFQNMTERNESRYLTTGYPACAVHADRQPCGKLVVRFAPIPCGRDRRVSSNGMNRRSILKTATGRRMAITSGFFGQGARRIKKGSSTQLQKI